MADFDRLFSQFRDTPWRTDPNGVPQEGLPGNGNPESTGWLSDGAVTADVIQANAVIAGKIDADAVTAREIAANTITAAEIAANTITANEIAANTITAAQIAASTITGNEIAANTITAADIAANTITASEIAANTITASEIAASAITADELAADSVITSKILAANVVSSKIELTISGKNFGANDGSAGSPGVYFDSDSDTGLTRATFGALGAVPQIVQGGAVAAVFVSGTTTGINGNVNPTTDNTYSVGTTSLRWTEVWAVDGTINTSDERLKRDIADSPLGLDFIRSLKPRIYRWRETTDTQARESVQLDGEALARAVAPREKAIRKIREGQLRGTITDADGNAAVERHREVLSEIRNQHLAPAREAQQKRRPGRRWHYGLIAQEVKAALDAAGVDAAFWKQSPDGMQSLSYTELTVPLLRAVQELAARVEELEHGRT